MSRIRILEAIRQGSVGGGETHVFDLSTRLDKSQFEPIVLSFTDGPMVEKLRACGIDTHVIHSRYPFDLRVYFKVYKLIKEKQIDIVHAHGTRAASNLLFPARFAKVKLIYTIHGWSFNANQPRWIRFIRKQAERFITRFSSLNICVSQSNLETGKKAIRKFDAIVINNGISFEKFNQSINNSQVINELKKQADDIWIGLIARITKQKDPITMVRAFKMASDKNPSLKLLIVGQGDLEQAIESEIAKLGLQEKIKVWPFRADVPEILKSIDIYCLPSLWEGLPIGLIEAMAMAKPVIATDVDGTREIITKETGLLIPKENAEQLASSVLILAADGQLRNRLGEAGRSLVLTRFGLAEMVKATESHYLKLKSSKS